ncbi:MAG: NAD(P)H-binding protein [bacterium]|nr:NAD(P)H-binding protein [bacterium]
MKVLLTGATGYVGSALREYLKRQGHDVRLLVRKESAHKAPTEGYDIVEGTVFNTNACLRATDGMDTVVHLVGLIRENPSQGIVFDEYHRVATGNMLEAAKVSGVERFIHMSALGTRENARSKYHRTKWEGEQLVQKSSLRWTIFRPAWIFSPGDGLSTQISSLVRKPLVPLIDGGRSLMQPVSLEDVCEIMSRSLIMPETHGMIYEVGGPDRIAFRDLVTKTAEFVGKHLRTMTVPFWAIKPFVAAMQRFTFFPLTVDQMKMLSEDNVCEIDPFVKTFQLQPKSFVEALPGLVR